MTAIVKCSIALAIAAAPAAALPSEHVDGARDASAAVRDCTERVEGGVIRPRAPRDTVAGPIGWYRLPRMFSPSQAGKETDGYPSPPIKALAIVRAPDAVTVWVPRKQRAWMELLYARSSDGGRRGTRTVTFRPCPRSDTQEEQQAACEWEPTTACRSGYTQFNGAIFIDYDRAPKQGRCARVAVRVAGETKTRRPLLFGPTRRC